MGGHLGGSVAMVVDRWSHPRVIMVSERWFSPRVLSLLWTGTRIIRPPPSARAPWRPASLRQELTLGLVVRQDGAKGLPREWLPARRSSSLLSGLSGTEAARVSQLYITRACP